MKVVLFCGGMGTRLREHSETIPKPLVPIGRRPIIWHIMRHYAHYGHKEFILCLGYGGDLIRKYFLDYNSYLDRDFVLTDSGSYLEPGKSDVLVNVDALAVNQRSTGASPVVATAAIL